MRAGSRPTRSSPTSHGFARSRFGPGLGTDPAVRQAVFALVAEARVPLVLDADGLNAVNGDLEPLRTRQTLGAPTIAHAPRRRVRVPRGPTGRRRSDRGGASDSPTAARPWSC